METATMTHLITGLKKASADPDDPAPNGRFDTKLLTRQLFANRVSEFAVGSGRGSEPRLDQYQYLTNRMPAAQAVAELVVIPRSSIVLRLPIFHRADDNDTRHLAPPGGCSLASLKGKLVKNPTSQKSACPPSGRI
ncbi:hypothetical protein Bbelb_047360 [Branchiostoma belcheri]|nr:hypothetical protein Bbelb_047360 [Branchiostoma belcheri]